MKYQATAFRYRLKRIAFQRLGLGRFGWHRPESLQAPREHVALMIEAIKVLLFAGKGCVEHIESHADERQCLVSRRYAR